MNILSLNTAFSESYVSITTNQKSVYKSMDSSLKQSENILGLIDSTLSEAGIDISRIDAIACVIGPGSFTGIRIGASIAKGFCTALKNIKRIPINSLDLLAYTYANHGETSDFWVVLNALSGNVFACKYDMFGNRLSEPMLAFGEQLIQITGVVVGLKEECLELCTNYVEFDSKSLAAFAEIKNKEQNGSKDFEPVYLRKSQAEAELDKKQKRD